MKIATDIEQSKKLAEILPIESADMYYWCGGKYDLRIGSYKAMDLDFDIPAWSLSALLNIFDDKAGLAKEYGLWFAYDNGKSYCTKHCDEPIDACVEMILKLKEKGLI